MIKLPVVGEIMDAAAAAAKKKYFLYYFPDIGRMSGEK